ncbi:MULTISPECIES: hypothetical protein [Sphingobacterium]|uniref:hypothetical protein n=1 Tax=Sphingobacterium TaxID=28453 RepID=UPI00257C38AC|nr:MULTISPECIES: hypothetical protein [Sphingobacterium]
MYNTSLKRKWDAEAVRQYQVQEVAEAEKKGRIQERAKAEAEKKESALKMLKNGFDTQLISDILCLPIQEIEKLK